MVVKITIFLVLPVVMVMSTPLCAASVYFLNESTQEVKFVKLGTGLSWSPPKGDEKSEICWEFTVPGNTTMAAEYVEYGIEQSSKIRTVKIGNVYILRYGRPMEGMIVSSTKKRNRYKCEHEAKVAN